MTPKVNPQLDRDTLHSPLGIATRLPSAARGLLTWLVTGYFIAYSQRGSLNRSPGRVLGGYCFWIEFHLDLDELKYVLINKRIFGAVSRALEGSSSGGYNSRRRTMILLRRIMKLIEGWPMREERYKGYVWLEERVWAIALATTADKHTLEAQTMAQHKRALDRPQGLSCVFFFKPRAIVFCGGAFVWKRALSEEAGYPMTLGRVPRARSSSSAMDAHVDKTRRKFFFFETPSLIRHGS